MLNVIGYDGVVFCHGRAGVANRCFPYPPGKVLLQPSFDRQKTSKLNEQSQYVAENKGRHFS